MLLYTSSAGKSGMLLFTRVKKAIFSLEQTHNITHQNPSDRQCTRFLKSRTSKGRKRWTFLISVGKTVVKRLMMGI